MNFLIFYIIFFEFIKFQEFNFIVSGNSKFFREEKSNFTLKNKNIQIRKVIF